MERGTECDAFSVTFTCVMLDHSHGRLVRANNLNKCPKRVARLVEKHDVSASAVAVKIFVAQVFFGSSVPNGLGETYAKNGGRRRCDGTSNKKRCMQPTPLQ